MTRRLALPFLMLTACLGTYTPFADTEGSDSGSTDGGDATSADDGVETTSEGATGSADGGTTDTGAVDSTGSSGTTGEPFDCDAFLQDCPDDGDKCVAPDRDSDETMCVPAGTDPPGSTCYAEAGGAEGQDTCDQQSQCYFWDNEPDGVCTPFCGPAPGYACGMGGECLLSENDQVGFCIQPCNPIAAVPDCDEQFFACRLIFTQDDRYPRYYGCTPLGTNLADTGEPCDWQRDCMPGHYCLAGTLFNCPTNDCCVPFCSITENPDPCTVHGANFECTAGSAGGENAPGNTGLCEYVP